MNTIRRGAEDSRTSNQELAPNLDDNAYLARFLKTGSQGRSKLIVSHSVLVSGPVIECLELTPTTLTAALFVRWLSARELIRADIEKAPEVRISISLEDKRDSNTAASSPVRNFESFNSLSPNAEVQFHCLPLRSTKMSSLLLNVQALKNSLPVIFVHIFSLFTSICGDSTDSTIRYIERVERMLFITIRKHSSCRQTIHLFSRP